MTAVVGVQRAHAAEGDQECAMLNWISTISEKIAPLQKFLGEMTGLGCTSRSNAFVGPQFQGGSVRVIRVLTSVFKHKSAR